MQDLQQTCSFMSQIPTTIVQTAVILVDHIDPDARSTYPEKE